MPAQPGAHDFAAEREQMVAEQLAARGIRSAAVLAAMRRIPRELFMPAGQQHSAYSDGAQPIDCLQTISQPYMVARMTELLELTPERNVLEIGHRLRLPDGDPGVPGPARVHDRVAPQAAQPGGGPAGGARGCGMSPALRGRVAGLAGTGPVRRHHRDRRCAGSAPAADRAARAGRPSGRPDRPNRAIRRLSSCNARKPASRRKTF